MATYVFTDIHGHAKPLRRILERIAPQDEDQFICLGDMIDRGPDPLGVIETVKTLPHAVVLQGNHEQMKTIRKRLLRGYTTAARQHAISLRATLSSNDLIFWSGCKVYPCIMNASGEGVHTFLCMPVFVQVFLRCLRRGTLRLCIRL